ncbi:MAG: SH3 domain-containing protein, partial [Anaerolineales bacterium]
TRVPKTATPTPIPETPTPTTSPTPESALLIADYNANVRSGPGDVFGGIDFLLQGDQANVEGRYLNDQSGTWYYITRVDQGLPGWIWGGAVTVAGNEATIPFLDSPPTPTPGPSPTPTSTS